MSIETWGLMPKSQEDNETIEEAIDRIVAEHEAEPTAHTGEGESLAAHRENEVLDHLEGSVVSDKMTATEMMWESNFSDHELWTKFDVHDYDWPGMFLPETGDNATSPRITIGLFNIIGATLPTTVDYYFQAFANIDNPVSTCAVELGFGITGTSNYDGFGFKAVDGQCSVYFKIGATNSTANIASFADGKKHVFRAFFVAADQKAYFYVDGVLVGELAKPAGTPATGVHFGFRLYANDYTGESYGIYQLRVTVVGGLN